MMPGGLHATEWAPLVLAASAIDSLPKADSEISAILRDVTTLFDPTPTVIKTEFTHRLQLTAEQPVHHECDDILMKKHELCESMFRSYTKQATHDLQLHLTQQIRLLFLKPIEHLARSSTSDHLTK
ncbi:hypothetical protein AYI69_g9736 [Smittium culicis]|uniref:Uncharacterized protein n=1 Tax=Smittium culicis TaxID=133412 RepID=A0A1R1XAQ2_9FUNG|nr:hypothetical protein AYI69_g9736 [Smittium culicis]